VVFFLELKCGVFIKMKTKMKTKKKTNQRQRRKTRVRRVKRGGGGGLHQLIKDEKQLFDLLNVSGLTPPDLRKTDVMLDKVLQMLETRMLLLKQYNDVHGFLYIDKDPCSCIPPEDEPNKRISPSIHNIVKCFGNESYLEIIHLSYIQSGFDAEKQLHKLLKEFIAEMRRLKFIAVMQHEFTLFGGSYNLGNALWYTMNQIHELHPRVPPSLTDNLREIIQKVNTAIIAIMNGMRIQIQLLRDIKTNAIPAMEKAYREKDSDVLEWKTIPAFLHPDGPESDFTQRMGILKQKIDDAIAQKVNAMNPTVEFVDPLNLSHLSHRTAPSSYAADGVLQPARAPKHAVAQIAADIALYNPDITRAQRMSMMNGNGMMRKLIHRLTSAPGQLSIDHAKLQSNFYHTPETEKKDPPPPPPPSDNHMDIVD
jgi:hypothetical protein